jgi:hypothetical protein
MAGYSTVDSGIHGGLVHVYAGGYLDGSNSCGAVIGSALAGAGGAGGTDSICGAGGGAYVEGLGPIWSAIDPIIGGAGGTATSGGAGGGSYIVRGGDGDGYSGYGTPDSSGTGNS